MTRIIDRVQGVVHFRNPADVRCTLCGVPAFESYRDTFGIAKPLKETSERVNCQKCAKVYCAVKNEPWNTQEPFEPETLENGIFAAVELDANGGDAE